MKWILYIAFLYSVNALFAQQSLAGKVIDKTLNEPVPYTPVVLLNMLSKDSLITLTDEYGRFYFTDFNEGNYQIYVRSKFFQPGLTELSLTKGDNQFDFPVERSANYLQVVDVVYEAPFESNTMSIIDGATLTHSKKTQEIDISKIPANTSINNARELFATVPGLNIWESDGGGLQLGIGARGLSPNRTEHFNTRQNGYDISADALGYPESYYTPPAEAIQSVQFIRGAASLQFGPQFGGMVNFKLITPSTRKIAYQGTHTYGAYNLVNTFNCISGTLKNRFSYLAYYNYKRGDGWRDNSAFSQHSAFGHVKYQFTEDMYLSIETTYMTYLAQQAGGLTDGMFENDPRQSIRNRNWFNVNWQIIAANYNWKITPRTMIDLKFFNVKASRQALGNLDKISRLDDMEERDLIDGQFNNSGIELRLLQRYPIGKKMKGAITWGGRYYQGETINRQGLADSTGQANFTFLNPDYLEGSDYVFPSKNYAAYLENMIQLSEKIWLSAGARLEYIDTKAEGTYREMVYHPLTNELLFDSIYTESKSNTRSILIGGVGITWRLFKSTELYSNIAQNYRGINFSDIRVLNPNVQVDPNIKDERGFNADLGFRARHKNWIYDFSAFFLYYDNKIGLTQKKLSDFESVGFRTNLGTAYTTGLECYAERKIELGNIDSMAHSLNFFVNLSAIYARYGELENSAYTNNWIELVPPVSGKIGIRYQYEKLKLGYLFSYVHKQYADATNASFDPDAVTGIIPSYYVMDLNASYEINKKITFKTGVNNLTNNKYFTRRATAYPGPGIIPSDGISFFVSVAVKL